MTQPFDVAAFQAQLTTASFGRDLRFHPSVGSTMDVARDAARNGAAEGTLVAADEQTAGRGRLGRTWVTPPAVNLASTLLLRPPRAVLREVAMIAPLAIVRALEAVTGLRTDIKWPNDVQAGGKKIAGILIETDLGDERNEFVLVGAGINVNFDAAAYPEIAEIATSVAAEIGRQANREAILAAYILHFEKLYADAKAGDSARAAWRDRLVTLGQQVQATWPGGSAAGTAEDVDTDGALLVRTDAGALVRIEAGDVTLRH